jgi:hypothetical protein
MRILCLVVVALLAVPALAETPAAAPQASPPDPNDDMICKTYPPPTGTLLGARKVCKTRRDWKEMNQAASDYARDLQKSSTLTNPPGH